MRCAWLLSLFFAAPATAEDLTVFAAASLAGPLDDIAEAFERRTGHGLTLVYAGSSTLARQVEAGAPADVVILANAAWMDHLAEAGAIGQTRRTLLTNRLVVIGPSEMSASGTLEDLPDMLGPHRLALALTEAVPAGIYARQALESEGIWEVVSPQVVQADNVRAALMLVAIGAAGLGIVYATDASADPRVTALLDVPESGHDPIVYPMALGVDAGAAAMSFYDFLGGPVAQATFSDAGFGVPGE